MLDETAVWPVKTNAGFLFNALLHPEFGGASSTPASSSATWASSCPIPSRTKRCGAAPQ
jgi:hypothetical protein